MHIPQMQCVAIAFPKFLWLIETYFLISILLSVLAKLTDHHCTKFSLLKSLKLCGGNIGDVRVDSEGPTEIAQYFLWKTSCFPPQPQMLCILRLLAIISCTRFHSNTHWMPTLAKACWVIIRLYSLFEIIVLLNIVLWSRDSG